MKKGLILWALLGVCGCAGYQVSRVPQPQGTYIPAIYAAGQITHAPTRNQALRDLAYRKDLTEGELEYMIYLLAIRKGTSEQLKDVLLTILNNPASTFKTKQRVAGVLPNLGLLPLDQKEIVDALAFRNYMIEVVPTENAKSEVQ
jgi:hypothetical protein